MQLRYFITGVSFVSSANSSPLIGEAINTHRTAVTENPQIDDVILKIFVLHMYLSTAFCKLN